MNVRVLFSLVLLIVVIACAPLTAPETAAPAETPAATETTQPTHTTTPTETPLPSATPDPVATIVALQSPIVHSTFDSPDGQWRVDLLRYECIKLSPDSTDEMALEQLRLVHLTDGTEKVVASQSLYCGGLGAFGFGGRAWSPNSRYFYFTDTREGVPDGGVCHWNRTLLRVKVESGAVENLLPGVISPDKTLIAMPDGNELVLWGADNGEVTRLPGPAEGVVAQAAWSPDGESLIYLHTQSKCMPYDKATVVRIAWPSLEQTVLLESETPSFRALAFGVLNEIELTAEDGQLWRFDLITRELKPAVNGQ